MPFKTITPQDADKLMKGAPKHVYLDVRSEPEFAQGHATGAVNVPIAHFVGGGMQGNEDFLRVVLATFTKDTPLVVGCKMGGRSARACEILANAGFSKLHNIDGGFGGRGDAADPSVQKGWQGSGLAVTKTPAPGSTYAELKKKLA